MAFAFGYYIVSFITALISPFWGFVLFMCSLLLRFQDHYPEIVVIKPFTLLLLGMLLSCVIHKDKLSQLSWKQDKLIGYMLGLSIFGLLVMNPGAIVGETFLYLCSIAIYYFASRILQTPMQVIILFFCLGMSVAYLGYLAIEDVAKFPETTEYIDHTTGRWQGIGYYANSNEFGQLMITTVPFLLAAILIRKSIFLSAAAVGLICVMVFVMIKSESRTVMTTLGLMFVGTFMLRGKGNIIQQAIVGGGMAVLMLVALTFTPGPIQERMSTVLDAGNDESFQGRTRAWGYGFQMVAWYPITGVGKGQWLEHHGLAPHNSFVQVMAELGIIGIVLYLWVIGRSIKQYSRLLIQEEKNNGPPKPASPFDEPEFDTKQDNYVSDLSDDEFEFESKPKKEEAPKQGPLNNLEKTTAIAGIVTFCGWLLYIFLGNQGFSIWMYFYLGLCAAYSNFLGHPDGPEENKKTSLFDEK